MIMINRAPLFVMQLHPGLLQAIPEFDVLPHGMLEDLLIEDAMGQQECSLDGKIAAPEEPEHIPLDSVGHRPVENPVIELLSPFYRCDMLHQRIDLDILGPIDESQAGVGQPRVFIVEIQMVADEVLGRDHVVPDENYDFPDAARMPLFRAAAGPA